MKKNLKKTLIVLGIVIALLLVISVIFLIKFNLEIKKMTPLTTKEVVENVFSIKDNFVNLYLIKIGDSFIAIDAGTNSKNILKELNKLNLDPLKVKAVFLTHNHPDHTAGLSLFSNAKIFISKKENFNFKNSVEYPDDNSDTNFNGVEIQCIFTPGHTDGSVVYIVNNNVLFSGDNFSIKKGKVDVFNEFFNSNTEMQKSSIRKLKKLTGINHVFTSHYGYSNNFNDLFKEFN